MNIKVQMQLGANANKISLPDLVLGSASFDAVHTWAGSYDVLNLSDHFAAYHTNARSLLLSHAVAPPVGYFKPLKHKLQSLEINGNFGESLPAIYFLQEYSLTAGDIMHLVPPAGAHSKSPDYLVRLGHSLASVITSNKLSTGLQLTSQPLPDWLPVECKSTSGNVSSSWKRALSQIFQFWFAERATNALTPGFAMVSIFDHGTAVPTLCWRLIVPKQTTAAGAIQLALNSAKDVKTARTNIMPLLDI